MKKYELDLSKYEVEIPIPVTKEDGSHVFENQSQEYPLRENINMWLRSPGVFRSAEDIAEAVGLAKAIRDSEDEDILILDEREVDVLKKAVNRLVELTADGKANLGGPIHEEAIVRVIRMKEVK